MQGWGRRRAIDEADAALKNATETERTPEQQAQDEQANKLRSVFFWVAFVLACSTVATSITLVLAVTFGDRTVESTVAVAFISGLSVQTVGILAIMAGYLFPRGRPRR